MSRIIDMHPRQEPCGRRWQAWEIIRVVQRGIDLGALSESELEQAQKTGHVQGYFAPDNGEAAAELRRREELS